MKNANILYIVAAIGMAYLLFLDITSGANIMQMVMPASVLLLLVVRL